MKKPTMEELFATLPDVPKGFKEECLKYASPVPIYYRRNGEYADCRCGKCNAIYSINEKPSRKKKTICSNCGTVAEFEWMKCTKQKWEYYTVVLIQCRTDKNIVARCFKCTNIYKQGEMQRFYYVEKVRYFMNMGDFYKFNHQYQEEWSTTSNGALYEDYIYPGWEKEIKKSNLKYFKEGCGMGLIDQLKAYSRNPALEIFEKIGLEKLKEEIVLNEGRSKNVNRRGKNLKAQLKLKNKQRINYLIKKNGGIDLLKILQLEEKMKIKMSEEEITWLEGLFIRKWGAEKDICYMLQFMSLRKLFNRIQKYGSEADTIYRKDAVFTRYVDYIKMREELEYDMSNEVYLFPKNLKEKHDEMVEEKHRREDQLYIKRQEEKHPEIRQRYKELLKKYGFEKGAFLIRPAKSATEIVVEGRALHHCVGRTQYISRHSKGKSFILFLRKREKPNEPYYTVEIRGKEILQWYGLNDRRPDEEIVEKWLYDYKDHLGSEQVIII